MCLSECFDNKCHVLNSENYERMYICKYVKINKYFKMSTVLTLLYLAMADPGFIGSPRCFSILGSYWCMYTKLHPVGSGVVDWIYGSRPRFFSRVQLLFLVIKQNTIAKLVCQHYVYQFYSRSIGLSLTCSTLKSIND